MNLKESIAFSYESLRLCASRPDGRRMLLAKAAELGKALPGMRADVAKAEELLKRVDEVLSEVRV